MTTRLFVSLNQIYVPLYLQVSLKLPGLYVATIPLVMFIAGFVTSSMMKFLNRKMGRKATFLLGCGLGKALMPKNWFNLIARIFIINLFQSGVASCLWVFFGCKDDYDYTHYEVYAIAALIGAGGSTMLVTRQVQLDV